MKEVNDEHVEELFNAVEKITRLAWNEEPIDVEALIERIRVAMMIEKMSRPKKAFCRAVIDYFEDCIEDRNEKEEKVSGEARRSIVSYFKRLADNLDVDD